MTDVVVTVPKGQWADWLAEGDLPGEDAQWESHFWIGRMGLPNIRPGERVYIVAHGRVRGFAPLVARESPCRLEPSRACLLRQGDAEAVTIPEFVRGFQGWRYRWWPRISEFPFADWRTEGVPR